MNGGIGQQARVLADVMATPRRTLGDWCAFGPDFINLQESVAGFGKTQELAKADYERKLLKDKTNDQTI